MQHVSVCSYLYLFGCGNSTTCACLPSTTWLPGRMAIITGNHGDGTIGTIRGHRWREAGSERRRPTEPADSMSLKHKGDSWRWGQSRGEIRAGGGVPERERHRDSFLCLPQCLPARSLPLSSYLAVHPLTSSQRPLSFFISFVALPPPHSLFTSFCLAGIYLEMITPPSSLHRPLDSLLRLPSPPSSTSASLSLHQPSLSFPLSITIKMVAVETRLFGNGGRKIIPALCLVDFDTTV